MNNHAEQKRRNRIARFAILLFFIIVFGSAVCLRQLNLSKYARANECLEQGQYTEALKLFNELGSFKESTEQKAIAEAQIKKQKVCKEASRAYEEGRIEEAVNILSSIKGDKASNKLLKQYKYELGIQYYESGEYDAAREIFSSLGDYEDSALYLAKIDVRKSKGSQEVIYQRASEELLKGEYEEALDNFNEVLDYKDSKEKAEECKRLLQEEERRLELSHTIAAGVEYVLAVTKEGKVKSVGEDSFGERSDVKSWENIVSVDCYGEVSVGLQKDGHVKAVGNLSESKIKNIESWRGIVDVAAGEKYVVALKNNGDVVSEGHNGDKQRNVSDWHNIIDVDTGWRFTVGLTKDHELRFAGKCKEIERKYQQNKEAWKDVVKISASGGEPAGKDRGDGHVVGLKKDGSVVAIGDKSKGQCKVTGKDWDGKIADIAAGDWYTVGLTKTGKVLITGENNPDGLLHTVYIEPEKLKKWTHVSTIAAGYGMTVVLQDGNVDIMGFLDGQNDGDRELLKVLNWKDIKPSEVRIEDEEKTRLG